jgi:hypothetical protein
MKQKEQFGWSCGYRRSYGNFHADNECCTCHSTKLYDTKEDAARAGLRHKLHPDSVYVYSTKTGYIGLAVGINFNSAKIIGRQNEEDEED